MKVLGKVIGKDKRLKRATPVAVIGGFRFFALRLRQGLLNRQELKKYNRRLS